MSQKLDEEGIVARTVGVEFQTEDFVKKQKCMTFNTYISHNDDLLKHALELVQSLMPIKPCRMVQLKVQNLRKREKEDHVGPKAL